MNPKNDVAAVVVTFNRKNLLKRCIDSILIQSRVPDTIIIVDNGSTDGTDKVVKIELENNPSLKYINLEANLGGGGGFHYGARLAFDQGYDWVWLMDDDCVAAEKCLEKLVGGVENTQNIYSPIILSIEDKESVLWGIKTTVNSGNLEVTTLPFNGFLIHRTSLASIGFPQKEFFIYGDDTEYNMRAKANGKKVIMVTSSIMYHPYKNKVKGFKIYKMFLNKLWTYYKLRNAIIIYKRYRYVSKNQVMMFTAAAMFYLLTAKLNFLKLWLEGLKDGINNRLYVKSSLTR